MVKRCDVKQTPKHVQYAYEQYVRAYNAYDTHAYWSLFHWPYTAVTGHECVIQTHPPCALIELKHQSGCAYMQIISLQVVAYSERTAHVVVRLARLDNQQQLIDERDMVYIYKKIHDEWKIYVVSIVDDARIDTAVGVELSG